MSTIHEHHLFCGVLSDALYGIEITHPLEILESVHIEPLPCMPDYVLGLCTIHGGSALVCMGHGVLCAPASSQDSVLHDERILYPLYLTDGHDALVLMLDGVHDEIKYTDEDVKTLSPSLQTGIVPFTQVLVINGTPVHITTPSNILKSLALALQL